MFEAKPDAASRPTVAFPRGFSWGLSTAAYQIEGAVEAGGRGRSIWDRFSHTPGRIRNGDTGDVACDHYNRLEEDLDLLSRSGVGVYRFSIAWPRVQPAGQGIANAQGLAFYDRLVDGLLARGITPVPTLYHWDLPQALVDRGEDWASRLVVDRFADYAQIVARALGDRVGMWTTLNEPWVCAYLGYGLGVHAPGVRDFGQAAAAHHHLLLSHAAAMEAIRASQSAAKVGIALNLMHHYPASEHEADIAATAMADAQLNASFIDPLRGKGYPANLGEWSSRWLQPGLVHAGDLGRIAQPMDFISVNTYHPRWICAPDRLGEIRAAGFDGGNSTGLSFGLAYRDVSPATAERTQMGWPIHAAGLRDLLQRVGGDFAGVPVYISENGFAGADYPDQQGAVHDPDRIAYLDAHLRAAKQAIDAGVDLRGFWQWSFLDNFEWSFGYGMRFGLVYVDYPTRRRTPKSSFDWYAGVVRRNELPAVTGARP
jgi:beta-glucosidase